jgi:hypothetical protein
MSPDVCFLHPFWPLLSPNAIIRKVPQAGSRGEGGMVPRICASLTSGWQICVAYHPMPSFKYFVPCHTSLLLTKLNTCHLVMSIARRPFIF